MDIFGKQHAGNLRGRTWTMEEFERYFGQEAQSKGNSAQFQAVAQALAELNRIKEGPDTKEHHQARLEAGDQLMRACQAYCDSRRGAVSARGRERLAVVDKLAEFQLNQGLREAENVRNRQWDIKEIGEYFREHEELKARSPEFQAVARAFEEFAARQNEVITPESAMAMIKSSDKLKKACQAFSDSMRGTTLASGLEHQAFIEGLSRFHEDLNLDQARDRRILKGYEGKTWGEAGKFQMAEMDLDGKAVDMVGDNVNQRMKVDYEGRKGFFTERIEIKSQDGYVRDLIEAVDRNEDPGLRRVLEEHQWKLTDRLLQMAGERSFSGTPDELNAACCLGEQWDQMEEGTKGQKESLGRGLFCDDDTMVKAARVVRAFQEQVKPEMGEDQKSGLMEKAIREHVDKEDKDLKKLLSKNKDFLMGVPPISKTNGAEFNNRMFKLALIQIKATDPNARPIDRLIEDPVAIHRFVDTQRTAKSAGTAVFNARFELDAGNELTSRNIASSRMAELLGIGNIIAHSEPMRVRKDGKVMTGCFMEFAKGLDGRTTNERQKQALAEVETLDTPGMNKDSSTLEVFDFICGQSDRHGGNMFYQVSEPDKNGKRSITGLQGIDSDLAFGDSVEVFMHGMVSWKDMVFIDKELAQKVQNLDRDTLEYAVGDLITQKQIDVMMERVTLLKDHMEKNMVVIDPDKWDLKEFSKDQPVDGLNDRGKRYVEGLKSMDIASRVVLGFDPNLKHKIGQANIEVARIKKERENSKVTFSFRELQDKDKRQALRREPEMILGKKSDAAVERAARLREEFRKKQETAQKGASEKTAGQPQKKSQGMGRTI